MKCLIIDDEPIARRGMKRLAERFTDLEVCALFDNAHDAYNYLQENDIDLVFLDIQMPGMTGIDLARKLPENTMIIFTTAYSDYAVEGFEVNAIDYLVKPIDPQRFDRAVQKARDYSALLAANDRNVEAPSIADDIIIVKADRRFMRVRFDDILFVEGLKDYVIIHTVDRKLVTRMTIKGMEELLPKSNFIRVNKSYIANLKFIDSFDTNDIFIGDHEIAIGQNYKETVLNRLMPGR